MFVIQTKKLANQKIKLLKIQKSIKNLKKNENNSKEQKINNK